MSQIVFQVEGDCSISVRLSGNRYFTARGRSIDTF